MQKLSSNRIINHFIHIFLIGISILISLFLSLSFSKVILKLNNSILNIIMISNIILFFVSFMYFIYNSSVIEIFNKIYLNNNIVLNKYTIKKYISFYFSIIISYFFAYNHINQYGFLSFLLILLLSFIFIVRPFEKLITNIKKEYLK